MDFEARNREAAEILAREVARMQAERNAIIEECARVYDPYIELLEKECAALFGLAFAHGYQGNEGGAMRGKELRAAIRALKDTKQCAHDS